MLAFYTADYYAASIGCEPRQSRRQFAERLDLAQGRGLCGALQVEEGGEAMSDATLHLSDADFNDLSDLLRRFGLNQIGRENFWREMNAQGSISGHDRCLVH